jgi:hypothetical protein
MANQATKSPLAAHRIRRYRRRKADGSASFTYASRLIDSAIGDDEALRRLERSIAFATGDMTSAEVEALRERISQARAHAARRR